MLETIQLIFKVGSFDVDDMILNTLGAGPGFCVLPGGPAHENLFAQKGGKRTVKYVGDKVSYIRHPFAKNSYFSLGLGLVCMLLATGTMIVSVRNAGRPVSLPGRWDFPALWPR